MNEKREFTEDVRPSFYSGRFEIDRTYLIARLDIAHDTEAELAVMLKGAARAGIIRLERILPFLIEEKTT